MNPPDRLKLGRTGLECSRIGFGCCPMGGHGWGVSCETEFGDAVHTALEGGIDFFDTADIYGLGESERVLGRFLKGRRDEVVLATKFGVRRAADGGVFYDNSVRWLRRALKKSLARLQTDYIDLYQVHYWDGKVAVEDIFGELERLQDAGAIRSYGVTNMAVPAELHPYPNLCAFSQEYSLLERTKEEEILCTLAGGDLVFLSWGSLAQGLLSGKYDRSSRFGEDDRRSRSTYPRFQGEGLVRSLGVVAGVRRIAKTERKPASTIALRWVLDTLPGSVALVGIKTADQAREASVAIGNPLAPEFRAQLDRLARTQGMVG